MAKFGGFGGMGGANNMQALMRQAQKMQEEALKAQQEVEDAEVEGQASGGLVKVVVKGDKTPVSISIDPSVVDPDDVEMLEDMILAATNDAIAKADALEKELKGNNGLPEGLF